MIKRILGVVVVLVIGLVLVACSAPTATPVPTPTPVPTTARPTTAASISSGNVGLPVYSGLKALTLSPVFERQFSDAFLSGFGGNAGNVKYSLYLSSDAPDKILAYYDSEMPKTGFSKQTIPDTGQTSALGTGAQFGAYTKGTGSDQTGALVVLIGPLDKTVISQFSAVDPAFKDVKAGDLLVILVNGVSPSNLGSTVNVVTPQPTK